MAAALNLKGRGTQFEDANYVEKKKATFHQGKKHEKVLPLLMNLEKARGRRQ